MGFNPRDFRQYIVFPACELLAERSGVPNPQFIQDLLVATCAQESGLGTWLHQTGRGDAVSVWQFEPASLADLLTNFASQARYKPALDACMVPGQPPEEQIIWNLLFGAVCCRLYYYRVREPLPLGPTTFDGLWHYYKTYYNTEAGSATVGSFQAALRLTDIQL